MTWIKVTALKDVEVYLSVVFKEAGELGGPHNSTGWVFLRKGQSRDDVSLIIGIHANYLPNEKAEVVGPNQSAVTIRYALQDGVQEFHGLLRAEPASI
jgi:hypothetical protein